MALPWKTVGLVLLAGLTPATFANAAPAIPRESINLLARADANHDTVVSRPEFLAARAARFDDLDRSHLGYLSMATIPSYAANNARVKDGLRMLIAGADTNYDGKVTRAEFVNAPTPAFDQADRNHDGVVDRAELAAVKAR